MPSSLSLIWLRRDLRLTDHTALSNSLGVQGMIQPVFIFDTDILEAFPNKEDPRVSFIAETLCGMHQELIEKNGGILALYGTSRTLIPALSELLSAKAVYAASDYEPLTIKRDEEVGRHLKSASIDFFLENDHLLISPAELLKSDGRPYKVFTPYSRAWLNHCNPLHVLERQVHDKHRYADFAALSKKLSSSSLPVIDLSQGPAAVLAEIGRVHHNPTRWKREKVRADFEAFIDEKLLHYHQKRDFPGIEGTSSLSPYLRFGLISPRQCYRSLEPYLHAHEQGAYSWLNELIWRDFYAMILYHFPLSATEEFQEKYRGKLAWNHDEALFTRFIQGQTGYPIIDAAMRQLTNTYWMHNRARMLVASFMTKHLLLDWRLGEHHFSQYLMDYEMASNVGGWQWAASTGTDAQPYFRMFNPTLQGQKFDPDGEYIRRFVPELSEVPTQYIHEPHAFLKQNAKSSTYPAPIVNHEKARKKAVAFFS